MKFEFDSTQLTDEELETLINVEVSARVRKQVKAQDEQTIVLTPAEPKTVEPVIGEVTKTRRRRKKRMSHRSKGYTLDEVRIIVNEHNRGLPYGKIAKRHGRTAKAIEQLIYKLKNKIKLSPLLTKALTIVSFGKVRGKRLLTKAEVQTIVKEHRNGKGSDVIAKILNRPKPTVYNMIKAIETGIGQSVLLKEELAKNSDYY